MDAETGPTTEIDVEGLDTTSFEALERGMIRTDLTGDRSQIECVPVRFPGSR